MTARDRVRKQILDRDGDACCWCACPLSHNMTIEHLRPKHIGGTDAIENLALSCGPCNSRRGPEIGPPAEDRRIVGWARRAWCPGWARRAWEQGCATWADDVALPLAAP